MAIKTGLYGASIDWVDLGLNTNPFPAGSTDLSSQVIVTQQEVFSLCEKLQTLQVFTGVAGIGKTIHAKRLAKHFLKNKRRPTQLITASKTIKASGLLKMICCRFNIELPPGDMVDSLKIDNIRRMLLKRKEAVALIIDDAQNLSPESLSAILRLTALQPDPIKLQVVLFGMPLLLDAVRKQWGELGIKTDFTQGMIRPWGAEQTEAYILARLQESGITSSKKVCKKSCQKIHQLSGGVPMQINRRANMMLDQLIKGHTSSKVSIVPKSGSALWAAALATSLTAIYFSLQAFAEPEESPWVANEQFTLAMAEEPKEESLVLSSLESEGSYIREEEPLVAEVAPSSFDLVMAELPESESIPVVLVESEDTPLVLMEAEEAEQVEDWLNGDGWAVQVLATTDEAEATRIASHYNLGRVVHAARQNSEKYLVVVGSFNEMSEAKAKSQELAAMDGSQPWIRSLSQIRSDVDNLKTIR